jgi:prevent-host-death family protein
MRSAPMASRKVLQEEVIGTAQARRHFSDLINRVANEKERVVLTRRSRALAAVVPIEDVQLLEELEEREDLKAVRAARREIKREGTVPWERIKKELGLS